MCQEQQAQNEAELSTLEDSMKKSGTKIERLDLKKGDLETLAAQLTAAMNETKQEMANRSSLRQIEHDEFLAAHVQDKEALLLLKGAKASITKFYANNNKKVPSLLEAPPAPDAGFESGDYGGKKAATKTLVTLFDMVIDDLAKEIETYKVGDSDGQKQFEADVEAMKDVYDSKEEKKIVTEKMLATAQEKLASVRDDKAEAASDQAAAATAKANLASDCAWVKTNFASRREKRKAEIDGLVEAKAMLTTVKEGATPV